MVIRKRQQVAVNEARANGDPTKQLVKIVPQVVTPTPTAVPAKAVVVAEKAGSVGLLDKAKNYYKGLIIGLGSLLIVLQQATPLFNFLGDDNTVKTTFTVVVLAVTTALAVLKDNEKWVDRIPSSS